MCMPCVGRYSTLILSAAPQNRWTRSHRPLPAATPRNSKGASMSKFDDFDTMVLEELRQRPLNFTQLQKREIMAAAKALGDPDFRVLDRRLQAMRKAGKIQYQGGSWHFVSTQVMA